MFIRGPLLPFIILTFTVSVVYIQMACMMNSPDLVPSDQTGFFLLEMDHMGHYHLQTHTLCRQMYAL